MQIVIGAPGRHGCPDVSKRWEQGLIEQFVPQSAVEALDEGILDRLARSNVVPVVPIRSAKPRMALDVNSVPLSLTIILGRPRVAISVSSSLATRRPDSEVSATKVRHSRVQLSTTVSTRKRRPSVI